MESQSNDNSKNNTDNKDLTAAPTASWWAHLHSFAESVLTVLTPCKPPSLLPLLPFHWAWGTHPFRRHVSTTTVIGTILCPQNHKSPKITLCFHDPTATDPFLLLDLPLTVDDLLTAGRVTLECGPAPVPLLSASKWVVHCSGRRVGFGYRRVKTEGEALGIEPIRAVTGGTGVLPGPPGGGGGRVNYLRSRFERVVGSAECESYHLMDAMAWVGHELSFFFLRV